MNTLTKLLILILLLGSPGCSFNIPFFGKAADKAASRGLPVEEPEDHQANDFIDRGRMVDAAALKQGKNVAIIPFRAGVNAEATSTLDRTALMIIKGVTDAFAEDKTGHHAHFNVLTAKNADDADLIVSGYVTDMTRPSKFKRWAMLKRKKTLGIKGKMVDAKTGNTVLTFEEFEYAGANGDFMDLGYSAGVNLGRYILSGLE